MVVSFQFILSLFFISLLSSDVTLALKAGIIYKLTCQITGKVYIGRTTREIEIAMRDNNSKCLGYKRGVYKSNDSIFQVISNKAYNITILEEMSRLLNDTDFQLTFKKRHRFYIEQHDDAVNKIIPLRPNKEYRQDNRDHFSQYIKKYHEYNKEAIAQNRKEYYNLRLKPLRSQKVACEVCGKLCTRASLRDHIKSKRHLTALAISLKLKSKGMKPLGML